MPFPYRKGAENRASFESDVLLGWDERSSAVTQLVVETQLVIGLRSDVFGLSLCRLLHCLPPQNAARMSCARAARCPN
jgi:hypothetical protein